MTALLKGAELLDELLVFGFQALGFGGQFVLLDDLLDQRVDVVCAFIPYQRVYKGDFRQKEPVLRIAVQDVVVPIYPELPIGSFG